VLQEHIHQPFAGDLILRALVGYSQLERVVDGLSRDELIAGEEAVGMIVAMNGEFSLTGGADFDMLTAVLFESSSAAKDYYEKHKDEAEEDQVIKQSGKWVYAGTEDAVEAFTK
jgi:hypothetical protein